MVPGPKKRFTFGLVAKDGSDIEVKSLVYFVPGLGRVTCGISAITNGDEVQFGLMCDENQFTEGRADLFVRYVEEIYTALPQALK